MCYKDFFKMKIIYPEDHNGSEMHFVNLYSGTSFVKKDFFFLGPRDLEQLLWNYQDLLF